MSHHHPGHHAGHHTHPVLMDPMGGHPGSRHMGHPGPSHYGAPGPSTHSVAAPMYQPLQPIHPQQSTPSGLKRPRPDDLDLTVSGLPNMDQGDIESLQQTPIGAVYAQAAASGHPTHHHHRLPDTGPPSKMLRRDDGGAAGGGAPSVVGQPGMPEPAARPRGPKLKFTPEDDQLLVDLKENKSLTWKQIADFFPGRSSGTLQVRYCTKLKAKTTQWTDETDQKLRAALQEYENEKWRIIANKVGTGFTPQACKERIIQLDNGEPPSSPGVSAPEPATPSVGPSVYGQPTHEHHSSINPIYPPSSHSSNVYTSQLYRDDTPKEGTFPSPTKFMAPSSGL